LVQVERGQLALVPMEVIVFLMHTPQLVVVELEATMFQLGQVVDPAEAVEVVIQPKMLLEAQVLLDKVLQADPVIQETPDAFRAAAVVEQQLLVSMLQLIQAVMAVQVIQVQSQVAALAMQAVVVDL
jgi:hypothetical protein